MSLNDGFMIEDEDRLMVGLFLIGWTIVRIASAILSYEEEKAWP